MSRRRKRGGAWLAAGLEDDLEALAAAGILRGLAGLVDRKGRVRRAAHRFLDKNELAAAHLAASLLISDPKSSLKKGKNAGG